MGVGRMTCLTKIMASPLERYHQKKRAEKNLIMMIMLLSSAPLLPLNSDFAAPLSTRLLPSLSPMVVCPHKQWNVLGINSHISFSESIQNPQWKISQVETGWVNRGLRKWRKIQKLSNKATNQWGSFAKSLDNRAQTIIPTKLLPSPQWDCSALLALTMQLMQQQLSL